MVTNSEFKAVISIINALHLAWLENIADCDSSVHVMRVTVNFLKSHGMSDDQAMFIVMNYTLGKSHDFIKSGIVMCFNDLVRSFLDNPNSNVSEIKLVLKSAVIDTIDRYKMAE